MQLSQKVALATKLGKYLLQNNDQWQEVKQRAYRTNPWFNAEFIDIAAENIARSFLDEQLLIDWLSHYPSLNQQNAAKTIGIVMAGNIPLVGFQDFLCVFMSGHRQQIKLSSKDNILMQYLFDKLAEWDPEFRNLVSVVDRLKNCDAYIATGSNNSSRYFDYYFGSHPHIIRKNRTSVAVLDGNENREDLDALANDLMLYFGLGCRNVTKLYVPKDYDFISLLKALKPYNYYLDFHKYHHNFDYQLAILIMNSKFYMSSGALLLIESEDLFSPISRVNYSFYQNADELRNTLQADENIQCIIGNGFTPFGKGQSPTLMDYADKVDTMAFLESII